MKKRILSIITILGIGVSFCSADSLYVSDSSYSTLTLTNDGVYLTGPVCYYQSQSNPYQLYDLSGTLVFEVKMNQAALYASKLICVSESVIAKRTSSNTTSFRHYQFSNGFFGGGSSSCPDMLIDVKYNSGNTSTITCDGINYITIDGLSTLTNSNINYEYIPYFNIDYKDENNQTLTESYSKNILYLSGGKFKKTYTGDNEWVLNNLGIGSEGNNITYTPVFDVTGTTDVLNTGNVFNNWSDNALKLLLSNVPGYIQYITIFAILLFLFGFLRRFKRKR